MKNRSLAVFVIALSVSAFSVASFAQQVKIRAQVTPSCTVVSGNVDWKFSDIYADGNIAVIGSYNCRGVFIFDVSNPDAPVLSSWYNPSPNQQFLEAIVIGNRGYFGTGSSDGVHIVDLTNPASPVLLGKVNSTSGGGYNTIHEMMVFDQGGQRYLLENSNSTVNRNLKIINVTDPAAPVLKWDFLSSDGGWVHAMHIRGNRMYLSGFSGSTRVDIFDIANLATQTPTFQGSVAVGGGSNHSAWTNETGEYLYSAREFSNGDLRVYDVRNPAAPLLIRTFRAADLNLNAITPHNPVAMGNKLYVAWYQAGVQVFDLADPTDPKRTGQYDTYQAEFAPSGKELERLENTDPWDIICGSGKLEQLLPTTYGGNWAVFPFLGENKVLAGDMKLGLIVLDVTPLNSAPKNIVSDFDGDRKTDLSVFTPATGSWNVEHSSDSTPHNFSLGQPGDIPVPADYNGDRRSEVAIWRPSDGGWYVADISGPLLMTNLGVSGDVPVPGDYDADGRTDAAIWRSSTGTWHISQSLLGTRVQQWGASGDKPAIGDFEGDGKSDLAVWRPSTGTWYILLSSSSQQIIKQWGTIGDRPMVTDFDGNGRAELTIFRPSTGIWYQLDLTNNAASARYFRHRGVVPIPADYDGDGTTDIATFRTVSNTWSWIGSGDLIHRSHQYGATGDIPVPVSFQPR